MSTFKGTSKKLQYEHKRIMWRQDQLKTAEGIEALIILVESKVHEKYVYKPQ